MAEVVALITQISGIINNSHGLVGWCCDVTGAIANVPEEILAVRSEVTTFEYNIRQLQSFVNTHPNDAQRLAHLNAPNGTLETAMAIVKQLMILLEVKEFSPMDSDPQIRLTTLEQLQWTLKKTEVRELLEKLGRCRNSIDSDLTIMLAQQVYGLREGLNETNKGISVIIKTQTESLTLEVMK
ncbi:putative NACHT domain-containing protein [Seiridium cardinale]